MRKNYCFSAVLMLLLMGGAPAWAQMSQAQKSQAQAVAALPAESRKVFYQTAFEQRAAQL